MKRLNEILPKPDAATSSAAEPQIPPPVAEASAEDACPHCGGAGFVRRPRALDDPRFGRAEPCECVLDETREVRRSRLERISNLGALTRFTFESLATHDRDASPEHSPNLGDVSAKVREYAGEPDGWIVLRGPSGSGKTHLAAAIANERIARDEPVLYMFVPDLLDGLRASYEPEEGEPGFETLFEQVRAAPLLILDDIDASVSSDWAREKLLQIVNTRYNASLPTVFTCHALPGDERIATRLGAGVVLDLTVDAPRPRYRQIGGMTRERLEEFGFHNFKTRLPRYSPEENESLLLARDVAHRFADSPEGWLLLQGESGCGKTHLAAAIATRVSADVFFAVVPDLLDHLRASFDPDTEGAGYDELFDDIRNAGLLVLDDLGDYPSSRSPWAAEKLFQIANYRASTRLPTIIATDLPIPVLRELYPRVAVRALNPRLGQLVTILAGPYNLPRRTGGTASPGRDRRR